MQILRMLMHMVTHPKNEFSIKTTQWNYKVCECNFFFVAYRKCQDNNAQKLKVKQCKTALNRAKKICSFVNAIYVLFIYYVIWIYICVRVCVYL